MPATANIGPYYAAADVFLFPTFYEPSGWWRRGDGVRPTVSSPAGRPGAAELIEHGESGWLTADPWDPDQIAEGLRALAADPGLPQRISWAARSKIEAYTWDQAADETLAVYLEVLWV